MIFDVSEEKEWPYFDKMLEQGPIIMAAQLMAIPLTVPLTVPLTEESAAMVLGRPRRWFQAVSENWLRRMKKKNELWRRGGMNAVSAHIERRRRAGAGIAR